MNKRITYFLATSWMLLFLCSCARKDKNEETVQRIPPSEEYVRISSDDFQKLLLVKGEKVYVPVYSEIFGTAMDHKIKLSAMLSVRNTDIDDEIIVTTVDYYDTKGKLIRHYVDDPIVLQPLETANYLVEYKEAKGGSGANFIVDWVAETEVTEPIIEAVMIGTASSLGISFTCQGKVIEYYE
nr:DUF3124 domain-containing protein [Bacteroidota bacterium]